MPGVLRGREQEEMEIMTAYVGAGEIGNGWRCQTSVGLSERGGGGKNPKNICGGKMR